MLSCQFAQTLGNDRPAFNDVELWEGGAPDKTLTKVWPASILWKHAESAYLSITYENPQDWSTYTGIRFWLHSEKATGSAFMFLVFSENEDTDGGDYYSIRIKLDWTGWKEFIFPFSEMGVAREPVGLEKIDTVIFAAKGWNNIPNPESVVRLDGFQVLNLVEDYPFMSDAELFSLVDLERPGLESVKQAVESGDIDAAKHELAEHIRNREHPKWFIDWRAQPTNGKRIVPPKPDLATDQWDYYSKFITVDWQGWKTFRFTKEEFEPEAFVEGEGMKIKKPVGWDWIRYVNFSARGWGMTPDPDTVLVFDQVTLIGKDKTFEICGLSQGAANFPELERIDGIGSDGKPGARWANQHLTQRTQAWNIPHDWTEYDAIEISIYSEKPTNSRFIIVLDSDWPRISPMATDAVAKKFSWNFGNKDCL